MASEIFLDEKFAADSATVIRIVQRSESSIKTPNGTVKLDEALDLLSPDKDSIRHVTADEDARLVKKIDRHLMPIMFFIFFLQQMDKQTLSFTSVLGISRDAGLVGDDYSMLGSIVYIAQLVLQPLSAYFLVKFRLSIYIPTIVTCWGAVLACMTAATTYTGLLVARFFLGVFEASLQASFIIIIQIWYRRHEQGFRIAIWYSNIGWINVFGGILMFGLAHIKSSVLYLYQIAFLVLGTITFIVGLLSFFGFPDNPVKSKFLTPEEKLIAVERLRANQQGVETKAFKLHQVIEMFLDIKSWCWTIQMFLMAIPSGGIMTFGPLIIRGFGFNGYNVMLLLIPHGLLQVLFMFGGFYAIRRFKYKVLIVLFALLPCIVATVLLLRTGRSSINQPILLLAYYMLSVSSTVSPIIINWQASNVAGHTKKAATTAFMVAGSYAGNIVGPLMFLPKEKPYYWRGVTAMLACYSCCAGIVVLTWLYLHYLNGVNFRRRVAKGKAGKMVDYSMMNAANAESEWLNEMTMNGESSAIGRHAFDDLTDLQNEEFIAAATWKTRIHAV